MEEALVVGPKAIFGHLKNKDHTHISEHFWQSGLLLLNQFEDHPKIKMILPEHSFFIFSERGKRNPVSSKYLRNGKEHAIGQVDP